jgi:hypothetical protein
MVSTRVTGAEGPGFDSLRACLVGDLHMWIEVNYLLEIGLNGLSACGARIASA